MFTSIIITRKLIFFFELHRRLLYYYYKSKCLTQFECACESRYLTRLASVFYYTKVDVRTVCIETMTMQLAIHSVLNKDDQANASQHSNVDLQANSPAYDWPAVQPSSISSFFANAVALRTIGQLPYLFSSCSSLFANTEALGPWPGQLHTSKRKP